jgi:hypothetical protein
MSLTVWKCHFAFKQYVPLNVKFGFCEYSTGNVLSLIYTGQSMELTNLFVNSDTNITAAI